MSEITHVRAEQSSGIKRGTHTIHDMDKRTQKNAAMVERAAAAVDSLRRGPHGLEGAPGFRKRVGSLLKTQLRSANSSWA